MGVCMSVCLCVCKPKFLPTRFLWYCAFYFGYSDPALFFYLYKLNYTLRLLLQETKKKKKKKKKKKGQRGLFSVRDSSYNCRNLRNSDQTAQPSATCSASVAQLDAPSDWRPGGRRFNPRRGRQQSFVEIDHEIFSTVILSLPLIQEGQLSVSGERMCTILVNRLDD